MYNSQECYSGPSLSKLQIDSEIVNVVENAFINGVIFFQLVR
jgi:hypothetical protein